MELEVGVVDAHAKIQVSLGKGLGVNNAGHLQQSQLAGHHVLNQVEVAVVLFQKEECRLVDLVRVLVVTGGTAVVKVHLALAFALVLGRDIDRGRAAGTSAGRGIWSRRKAGTGL